MGLTEAQNWPASVSRSRLRPFDASLTHPRDSRDMITRILLDHEPVADGGSFVRASLLIDGVPLAEATHTPPPGSVGFLGSFGPVGSAGPCGSVGPVDSVGPVENLYVLPAHLSARNVHVSVTPGRDAEFVQMIHCFSSRGSGDLLTIEVGDVYEADRARIRMEALVAGAASAEEEVEIGRIVVFAQVRAVGGAVGSADWELRALTFPIRLSSAHGCRVRAHVRSIPCSIDPSSPRDPIVELPLEDSQWAM